VPTRVRRAALALAVITPLVIAVAERVQGQVGRSPAAFVRGLLWIKAMNAALAELAIHAKNFCPPL
jgi:hypothetical protein